MDHDTIAAQLFAFYDGELIWAARRIVNRHVLGCAECRTVLAQWNRVARVFFQPPAVPTSEMFVARVMRGIATPPPHSFRVVPRWLRVSRWLVPAVGLAAMVVLLIGRSPVQQAISTETLLLSDEREPVTLQQVLTGERPTPDDVLGLLMEDAS